MTNTTNDTLDCHGVPYPGYVNLPELRSRWDCCKRLAEVIAIGSGATRGSGDYSTFIWYSTRSFFDSNLPTGDVSEVDDPQALAVLEGQLSVEEYLAI
jgi:hypothetical protein